MREFPKNQVIQAVPKLHPRSLEVTNLQPFQVCHVNFQPSQKSHGLNHQEGFVFKMFQKTQKKSRQMMILEVHSPNPKTWVQVQSLMFCGGCKSCFSQSTSKASGGRTKAAHRRRTAKCEVRNIYFSRDTQLPFLYLVGGFKDFWNFHPENWGI